MTPDYIFPGSGALLGSKLGTNAPALDIRQQCAAMLFGLQIIDGLVKTGAAKTILFVGAEAHAGFMPWDDWSVLEPGATHRLEGEERARANDGRGLAILFGDGAGAMLFRATDRDAGLVGLKLYTDGDAAKMLYVPGGGFRKRPYWDREQFESRAFTPRMDGRELFRYAVTHLPKTARELMAATGTQAEQISWFLAHQANARINDYIRKELRVPPEKMPMNIDRFGNTSAGTIPILVDELTRAGKLQKGELNMMLALGAGIHWGCALVRW
jgi:3-oxoacyl-[acyl-carrier-protein] synthase-3